MAGGRQGPGHGRQGPKLRKGWRKGDPQMRSWDGEGAGPQMVPFQQGDGSWCSEGPSVWVETWLPNSQEAGVYSKDISRPSPEE